MHDRHQENNNVIHPRSLIERDTKKINIFNNKLAVAITTRVGTMWSAYLFAILSLTSLPAILVTIDPNLRSSFPSWIIKASVITLIAWISQNFLQLVLLPIIMVGQNVIQGQQDAKATADHRTLTYLANLQEEQMQELANQGRILKVLEKRNK